MNSIQTQPSERQEKVRDIQQKAKTLTDDITELFELYYKLAVVTATEKASGAASASITGMVILFFFMFTLLFAGVGLGWFLGEKLNSFFAGFSIVAGIFAFLIIVTIALRKSFLFPFIRNTIIKKIYE